ncbi:energy transducer TonB [Ereboglobus luteus]|uniref:TonB C-terminal domain-containing protein n=1 Tax=Ereboglobus luteus TaxID=1796921 RepID=A0A2U8E2B9_9BACT|nr:energy transducer TonB [Ereboglobus luteus]AWI08950.1 hypothetical protein CKA38_06535 [Ereboglobus luteus]
MKTVNKLAAVLSLALVGAVSSSSVLRAEATDPGAYIASYRSHKPEFPAPVRVVAPSSALLAGDENDGSVDVTFVVNAKGRPTAITVAYASDEALVGPVVEAVERWKFTPAIREGVPVATKVMLPVRFTIAADN